MLEQVKMEVQKLKSLLSDQHDDHKSENKCLKN